MKWSIIGHRRDDHPILHHRQIRKNALFLGVYAGAAGENWTLGLSLTKGGILYTLEISCVKIIVYFQYFADLSSWETQYKHVN